VQYELHWFEQLINGELCPLQATPDKYPLWYNYLQEHTSQLTKQFILLGNLDKDGTYAVRSTKKKFLGSQAIIPWPDINPEANRNATVNQLINQVVPSLGVQRSDVNQTFYWIDTAGVHLEFYAQQDLNRLMGHEVRYAFYLYYLEEYTQATKQKLTETVCRLSSDKKAQKFVQNHQRILVRLCTDVMQQLSEEERQHIYCISEELTVSDIYKRCFQALEDIIAHLEQHFAQYLDVSVYAPYRSRIISFGRMVKKFAAIQQTLRQSAVSPELLAVLEKPFDRIATLSTEPTTYAELLYLKKFIQELGCLIERGSINDYHVAEVLFGINFNSSAFLSWMMSQLDRQVAAAVTIADKLETLYHYRKVSMQQSLKTKQAYQSSLPALDGQIRKYIDEDIQRYRQQLASMNTAEAVDFTPEENEFSEKGRVPTPFTVLQLAHLLGLLFEVKLFPKGYKKEVFRWFARMVSTPRTDRLAAKSLYDRQYEADEATREVVQELLQKMINLSRKRQR
jgi:hypothetical protein